MRRHSLTVALALVSATGCTYLTQNELNEAQCNLDVDGDGAPRCDPLTNTTIDCEDDPDQGGAYQTPGGEVVYYDGWDNDCDGSLELDADGDGYPGISKDELETINPDAVWPASMPYDVDCDDEDPEVNPGKSDEPYDGIDADCAGDLDAEWDFDNDGHADARRTPEGATTLPRDDCLDTNNQVYPGSPVEDVPYDGIDHDCDGSNDYDQDGDGWMPPSVTRSEYEAYLTTYDYDYGYTWEERSSDCLDEFDAIFDDAGNPIEPSSVNPAAADFDYDGIDSDCDQTDDFDRDANTDDGSVGDGFYPAGFESQFAKYYARYGFGTEAEGLEFYEENWGDCDDYDATENPAAFEIYGDGIDQDCDGGNNTSPMGYGDYSQWENPRPVVLGATNNHYMLITITDEYAEGTSSAISDRGVFLYFDPDARGGEDPEGDGNWNPGSTKPLLTAFDAEVTPTGFVGIMPLASTSSVFLQLKEYQWDGSSEDYVSISSATINGSRSGSSIDYTDADLRYDGTLKEWAAVACSASNGAQLITADYSSGTIEEIGRSDDASLTTADCFIETTANGRPDLVASFSSGGSVSSIDISSGVLGGSSVEAYTSSSWMEVNTNDDLILLWNSFSAFVYFDETVAPWTIPTSDSTWLDVAYHDGVVYVAETTPAGKLYVHESSDGASWDSFEVPVTIPIDYRTTETLDVLYGSIHVDDDRVVVSAVGNDSVGDTYVGWSFVGGPL